MFRLYLPVRKKSSNKNIYYIGWALPSICSVQWFWLIFGPGCLKNIWLMQVYIVGIIPKVGTKNNKGWSDALFDSGLVEGTRDYTVYIQCLNYSFWDHGVNKFWKPLTGKILEIWHKPSHPHTGYHCKIKFVENQLAN